MPVETRLQTRRKTQQQQQQPATPVLPSAAAAAVADEQDGPGPVCRACLHRRLPQEWRQGPWPAVGAYWPYPRREQLIRFPCDCVQPFLLHSYCLSQSENLMHRCSVCTRVILAKAIMPTKRLVARGLVLSLMDVCLCAIAYVLVVVVLWSLLVQFVALVLQHASAILWCYALLSAPVDMALRYSHLSGEDLQTHPWLAPTGRVVMVLQAATCTIGLGLGILGAETCLGLCLAVALVASFVLDSIARAIPGHDFLDRDRMPVWFEHRALVSDARLPTCPRWVRRYLLDWSIVASLLARLAHPTQRYAELAQPPPPPPVVL
jgi:hypothetical protein